MRLGDVAKVLNGRLFGDESLEIFGVSSVEKPKPGTLVFCTSTDVERLKDAVPITDKEVEHPNFLVVDDIRYALAVCLNLFYPEEYPVGISQKAYIDEDVEVGQGVYIGPFSYIGRRVKLGNGVRVYPFSFVGDHTVVGDESVIFSGVHIYPRSVIGKRVRIHSGAVIGADGFGYYIGKDSILKLNHIGSVIIEDDVEIGANTTIDRAMLDETVIGKGTKIDNLVMVGHNCKVGERNMIVSQCGLSGSVKTGKNVMLAGQVGVADHVNIGNNVKVSAKSGVANDLESDRVYGANLPAIEWIRWKRIYLYLLKLPDLFKGGRR